MKIRSTTEEDLGVFVDTVHAAFGRHPETPVDGGGLWWSALEMDRGVLALTADGRPVGTAAAYSFELTLPGEILAPVAGVTAVGVLPSHRRRGVLSGMMRPSSRSSGSAGNSSPCCWPPRPRSTVGTATDPPPARRD
jgi:hypothetical protein